MADHVMKQDCEYYVYYKVRSGTVVCIIKHKTEWKNK